MKNKISDDDIYYFKLRWGEHCMTKLKDIQNRKLKLVQSNVGNAREHIDQAYEKQDQIINEIIETIFEPAANGKLLQEIMKDILSRIFYNRPSKAVITFLRTVQQFNTQAVVNATNDFNVKMLTLNKRSRVPQNLFYAYLKTAQKSLGPEKRISHEDIWGDSLDDQ